MSRGNARQRIFRANADFARFMRGLEEIVLWMAWEHFTDVRRGVNGLRLDFPACRCGLTSVVGVTAPLRRCRRPTCHRTPQNGSDPCAPVKRRVRRGAEDARRWIQSLSPKVVAGLAQVVAGLAQSCGRSPDRATQSCGRSPDRATQSCGRSPDRATGGVEDPRRTGLRQRYPILLRSSALGFDGIHICKQKASRIYREAFSSLINHQTPAGSAVASASDADQARHAEQGQHEAGRLGHRSDGGLGAKFVTTARSTR